MQSEEAVEVNHGFRVGRVGFRNCDRGTGVVITRLAKRNDHVQSVNGATLTTDRFGRTGNAYAFDGVNDWVTVLDSAGLDLSSALTLEAWVKPNTLGFWKTIVMKEQPGNLVYGMYANTSSNRPAVEVYVGYLRRKVGADTIATVRGVGYRFRPA